jgi:hypothetical protein
MRYRLFGDTGGKVSLLRRGLEQVGFDNATGKLPEDLTVVHVGDLMHKGSTDATVAFVDRVMAANPGQWVQLLGNHELQYFAGAPKFWRESVHPDTVATVHRWWETGAAQLAWGLSTVEKIGPLSLSARPFPVPQKPLLVTHAGVTRDFWEVELGPFENIEGTVAELNALPLANFAEAGQLLYGFQPNFYAGPAWAICSSELWTSWHRSEEPSPVLQVHGHTSPYDFSARSPHWRWDAKDLRAGSKVNPELRTVATPVAETLHIAIDPGYDAKKMAISADAYQPSLEVLGF